jgi:hypothetical protein
MSRISRSLSLKHSFDQYHGPDYGHAAGDYILLGGVKIRNSFKKYEVRFLLRQHENAGGFTTLLNSTAFSCEYHLVFVFLLSLLRPSICRYLIFIVICLNGS